MRAIIKTNLDFYDRHLEKNCNTPKTQHTAVYLKVIFILHWLKKKSLGAKDKIPNYNINDSASQENHNAPKKKKKDEKCYLLQTKK